MKKAHKEIMLFFIISAAIIITLWAMQPQPQSGKPFADNELVYYYGTTCPHCKIVQDFMESDNISARLAVMNYSIEKKEVYLNATNSAELKTVAQYCQLNTASIGVPFMYFNGSCYIGDVDVIKILNSTVNP